MARTITDELACRLLAEHERPGTHPRDLFNFAPVDAIHVRDDDYQSYGQLIIRDPEGALFAFEFVRNFGAGEGQCPEPSGDAVAVALTPMEASEQTVIEYKRA